MGITNKEGQAARYGVDVLLQPFRAAGTVNEVEHLEAPLTSARLGETWERSHSISPEMTGENLRLTYFRYVGSDPDDTADAPDSAFRSTHVWVDVPP